MNTIYLFSGPCGCGKTTLSNAYARHLVDRCGQMQAYVIHGDDFHAGFAETSRRIGSDCPQFLYWPDILRFNWECILAVTEKALERKLDVIIDYVVEDELPLVQKLAKDHQARLFYVVLTASEEELKQRLTGRGSSELIDRSLFLKAKLENDAGNQKHLYQISGMTVEEEIAGLEMERFEVKMA